MIFSLLCNRNHIQTFSETPADTLKSRRLCCFCHMCCGDCELMCKLTDDPNLLNSSDSCTWKRANDWMLGNYPKWCCYFYLLNATLQSVLNSTVYAWVQVYMWFGKLGPLRHSSSWQVPPKLTQNDTCAALAKPNAYFMQSIKSWACKNRFVRLVAWLNKRVQVCQGCLMSDNQQNI